VIRDLLVPLIVALVSGVLSFLTGILLARHRARVDAQQQYQLQARQRLYAAVGPLRFQLVIACREVASRIEALHKRRFDTAMDGYFGPNTLYRLLRPLTLAELIERQTNYVDFSVDRAAVILLRFQAAAYDALTRGASVFRGLPLDWSKETQHVYKGRLQHAANLLVVGDQPPRCARFDEFPAILQRARQDDPTGGMARLASLLDGTSPARDPVLWSRLVAYGYIANWLLAMEGGAAGYRPVPYPVTMMLNAANDAQLNAIAPDMPQRLVEMIEATPGGNATANTSRP
jgi:hypothetical protein